jgi:hypothetical protein
VLKFSHLYCVAIVDRAVRLINNDDSPKSPREQNRTVAWLALSNYSIAFRFTAKDRPQTNFLIIRFEVVQLQLYYKVGTVNVLLKKVESLPLEKV